MKHDLLSVPELNAKERNLLERNYVIHMALTPEQRRAQIARLGATLRAVLTKGQSGFTAEEIAALPRLGIICSSGVGFEGIDLAAALQRGIFVTNSPDANASSVADNAMGLLLAVVRNIPYHDRVVREGGYRVADTLPGQLTGRRLGVLGLGRIGLRIARRAEGFDMDIAYHNRQRRSDVPYAWAESPLALAKRSDFLVVAVPGGPATRHIVNAEVLAALGPDGYLVNAGRGSAVDTQALIAALRDQRIAGAGLDVVEEEPNIPLALRELPNVVFTPHIGGQSPESVLAKTEMVMRNLDAYFAGQPVLTPITGA